MFMRLATVGLASEWSRDYELSLIARSWAPGRHCAFTEPGEDGRIRHKIR
jgi:hypothetical protein